MSDNTVVQISNHFSVLFVIYSENSFWAAIDFSEQYCYIPPVESVHTIFRVYNTFMVLM